MNQQPAPSAAEPALRKAHETLLTVLDSIDATIYAAEFKTHRILFMNRHMKELFGYDLEGQLCWDVFRGETGPCGHCTNDRLLDADGLPTGVVAWECQNPITGKWYVNYDRAIKWLDGRYVRLQVATDITELKRAEEALRESENRYRQISELTSDFAYAFTVQTDGRLELEWVTGALERISGFSPAELRARGGWESLIHPEDLPVPRRQLAVLLSGRPSTVKYRVLTRGGEVRWMLDFGRPVLDSAGGKVTRLYGAVQDITERKLAEDALREAETRHRQLFEGVPVALYRTSLDGRILDANPALVQLLGYPDLETLQKVNAAELEDPEDRRRMHALVESQGTVRGYETRVRRHDGSVIWVQDTARAVHDPEGRILHLEGSLVDITERKASERKLRESEKHFRQLAESSPFGLSVLDEDARFEYLNPKFVEIFGYTLAEIPSKEVWFRLAYPDPNYRRQVVSAWQEDIRDLIPGSVREREFTVRCRNGEDKTIHFRNLMLEDGKQYMTYEDVTAQRQLESRLLHSQKMEAIGTLAGGIAHDFNNLLMGILGNVSLMIMDRDPENPDHERLKSIEEHVSLAARLTKQLLGFARGGRYEVRPVDLNQLIEKTADLFGRTRKEISIRRNFQEGLWTVAADEGQIQQVLLNLFLNAWQAMPEGGMLSLQTENVTLDESFRRPYAVTAGDYVRISVIDTGVGMDEETRKKAFDPFFSTKQRGRGTGLGLASAYGIVKNHDGLIEIFSEKGMGATFHIYLPASKKPARKVAEPAERPAGGGETLLLVDDEKMILEVASEMLGRLGYRVLIAHGGAEALKLYEQEKDSVNLVVLDMIMPGMGGAELYDRLKTLNPGVRALLASGYSIDGKAKSILDKGCDGFIQKPFDFRSLAGKIREILDRPR